MVSKSTFFVSIALVALVGYIAGTRSDQLYAAIAPVFGIKASADSLNTSVLQDAYRNLKANYDGKLDADALSDGAVRGMVAAADDRYTVFMDKKEAEEFNRGLSGQVSGIGSEIGRRSNQPTVLRVLNDSPAEKAGVKSGDVFVAVNGEGKDGAAALKDDLMRGFSDRYYPGSEPDVEDRPSVSESRQHARVAAGTYTSSRAPMQLNRDLPLSRRVRRRWRRRPHPDTAKGTDPLSS